MTAQTVFSHVSLNFTQKDNKQKDIWMGPTWFVRLRILLQLRDKVVKLLLSLLSAFQAPL